MLAARGHLIAAVQVVVKDPAILVSAAEAGAVVLTADKWFLEELYRRPTGQQVRYALAGVVQVSGQRNEVEAQLRDHLPMIEFRSQTRRRQGGRVGVDLSGRVLHGFPP